MVSSGGSARAQPSARIIVEEVLCAVLSPVRVRDVLKEACALAGIEAVPGTPVALRVFVEGALFSVLSRRLGISDALDIGEQVRGALALALRGELVDEASGIRTRKRAASTTSAPVLVLSQASLVVFLLQDMLSDSVNVVQLKSQDALENQLARLGAQPLLIVVDRRHPCVGLGACPALKKLQGSTVIWWGAGEEEQTAAAERLVAGPRLIPTSSDMDLADLGVLCRGVIELM